MAIPATTIGLKISIAAETTAGTRPTSGYTHLKMVTSFPELDLSPDTIDTTSYDNLIYKSSTPGLIDTTGAQAMEAIYSDEITKTWNDIVTAYESEANEGKGVWLAVQRLNSEKAWFLPIEPIKTGVPNFPLNDVIKINLQFTLAGDIIEDTAPTYADEA